MTKPLVSISCITYNHELYIRDCLEGMLMQQCDFDFEILIHDDASTDNTQEIIKEYQEKYPDIIKPIFQTENQYSKGSRGFNATYNFPRVAGRYIALCEGDDYWTDPLKLQKQVNYLESHPNVVLCAHEVNRVNDQGELVDSDEAVKIFDSAITLKESIKYSSLEMLGKSFSPLSMVFKKVNLNYSEALLFAPYGDVVLIALLSQHGSAVKLNFVGGNYRMHPGGVYSSNDYISNILNSITTRRIVIKHASLTSESATHIKKEIRGKRIKALKNIIKTFNFKDLINVVRV